MSKNGEIGLLHQFHTDQLAVIAKEQPAIGERQTAHVQLIMNMLRDGLRRKVAHNGHAERRRDVAGGGTGFEDLVLRQGTNGCRERGDNGEDKEVSFHESNRIRGE